MSTYNELTEKLKNNHFQAGPETRVKSKGTEVVGLRIYSTPILQERDGDRIREVLKDYNVTVEKIPNEDYYFVKLKK